MISTEACMVLHGPIQGQVDCNAAIQQLLQRAEDLDTKSLWTQMTRLNPLLPEPNYTPHFFEYAQIRPSLLQTEKLITEKQGADGRRSIQRFCFDGPVPRPYAPLITHRYTVHYRYNLWSPSNSYAKRYGAGTSTHCFRLPFCPSSCSLREYYENPRYPEEDVDSNASSIVFPWEQMNATLDQRGLLHRAIIESEMAQKCSNL